MVVTLSFTCSDVIEILLAVAEILPSVSDKAVIVFPTPKLEVISETSKA